MNRKKTKSYANPIISREVIAEFISHQKIAISLDLIASHFSYSKKRDLEALKRRVRAMIRDGQIKKEALVGLKPDFHSEVLKGSVEFGSDGVPVLVKKKPKLTAGISRRQLIKPVHGDQVIFVLERSVIEKENPKGKIKKILSRSAKELVGQVREIRQQLYFFAFDSKYPQRFVIKNKPSKLRSGDAIRVEIRTEKFEERVPEVYLLDILDYEKTADLQIDAAVMKYGLPCQFSSEVNAFVSRLPRFIDEKERISRVDLTEKTFVTIDGEDAQDYDDAIFCESLIDGFNLIVAIADVAHYVKRESKVDLEACSRGTSVYFPLRVIPMLPEVISNNLCSLVPNQERLVLACDMQISKHGEIRSFEFYEAIIESKERLTYDSVQSIINSALSEEPYKSIWALADLTKKLLDQKKKRGALEFESAEPEFHFNEKGKISSISLRDRNFSHLMVEESMLCANVCAANFLSDKELPLLYRVHPEPEAEKKYKLRQSLIGIGLDLGEGTLIDYQRVLEALLKVSGGRAIQFQVLRSMQQAVYKTQNEGHFGLGYDKYTHFTSPIRRYPDLIIHRLMKSLIKQKNQSIKPNKIKMSKKGAPYDYEMLTSLGEHLSFAERRADEAVFHFLDWVKCEFMENKVGSTFSGSISAVTSFGFFVHLDLFPIEGLVHVRSLKNDYFYFRDSEYALVGQETNTSFGIGDLVRVKLLAVKVDDRKIDLQLVKHVPLDRRQDREVRKRTIKRTKFRGN
ncbi:MAG: ribonuclease R [Pseudomonadota bacterium]|nr:ribonuclease R [Pseudomonadota bacterium]